MSRRKKGKNVMRLVSKLQAKHKKSRWKEPIPNLKEGIKPRSGRIESLHGTAFKPRPKPPTNLIVDTLHKQEPMVLTREDLPWAGGRKP